MASIWHGLISIAAHTGRNTCVMILTESCFVEVDRVNFNSDMFHVIKTLTNLWRRGLIRKNYFPHIFVCYIKQIFTALMMLSSKRSIFSLSKCCYGNMKIWMSCTSRLWKIIKRRNLHCCVNFYFIQASSDYFGTLYDML